MVISLLSPALSAFAKWQIRARGVERCETQPGEAWAWPGRVVVRALVKWRGSGLMRFNGQVDGHVLRAWTPCV